MFGVWGVCATSKRFSYFDSENRFFLEEHERLVSELKEYQKSKGIKEEDAYKYMIQEDHEGNPNGLFVGALNSAYYSAQKLAKEKSLVDFLQFLGNEHTLSVNQEKLMRSTNKV